MAKIEKLMRERGFTERDDMMRAIGYKAPSSYNNIKKTGKMQNGYIAALQAFGIIYDMIKLEDPAQEEKKEEPAPEKQALNIDYDELAKAIWRNAPKIDVAGAIITAITSTDTAKIWRMVAKAVEDGTKSGIKEARKERAQYQAKEN